MVPAVIGLVGVVVGGVLTALQNAWLERRRGLRQTASAELLFLAALEDALDRVENTLDTKQWWPPQRALQLGVWTDQSSKLSPDIPIEGRKRVVTAFETLTKLDALAATRRREMERAGGPDAALPALTNDDTKALRVAKEDVPLALAMLRDRDSHRRQTRTRAKVAAFVASAMLVAGAVSVGAYSTVHALTTRGPVTADALAASIERSLGVDFASCDPVPNSHSEWLCTLAQVTGGPRCEVPQAPSSASALGLAVFKVAAPACSITEEDTVEADTNSEACWIIRELLRGRQPPSGYGLAPEQPPPHVLQSPIEAGCI